MEPFNPRLIPRRISMLFHIHSFPFVKHTLAANTKSQNDTIKYKIQRYTPTNVPELSWTRLGYLNLTHSNVSYLISTRNPQKDLKDQN